MALHHHGEEPAAAGYALAELLHLTQSSIPQQRVLALKTLAVLVTRVRDAEETGIRGWSLVLVLLLPSG